MSVGAGRPQIFGGPSVEMTASPEAEYADLGEGIADPADSSDDGGQAPDNDPPPRRQLKADKKATPTKPQSNKAPAAKPPARTPAAKPDGKKSGLAKIKTQPKPAAKLVETIADVDDTDGEPIIDDENAEFDDGNDDGGEPANRRETNRSRSQEREEDGGDEFDSDLLEQAARYDLNEDDAREFGSAKALRTHMTQLDRQAAAWARRQMAEQGNGQQQQQQQAQQPKDERPSTPPPQTQTNIGFKGIKLNLDPETMSEETIAALSSVEQQVNELFQPLVSKLEQFEQAQAAHQDRAVKESQARFESEMDSFYDSLGEDYQELFGSGPLRALNPNDPVVAKRIAHTEEMRVLAYADHRAGRKPDSTPNLAKRALAALHSDHLRTVERRRIQSEQSNRRRSAVSRPSGKTNKALTPMETAARNAQQRAREKGHFEEDADESDYFAG